MVISSVTDKKSGKKSVEPRFFINSYNDVVRFANAVRSHWACESGHWVLDTVFSEDKNQTHEDFGPENTAMFRRIAQNILTIERNEIKKANPKKAVTYKELRHKASLDYKFLEKLLINNLNDK